MRFTARLGGLLIALVLGMSSAPPSSAAGAIQFRGFQYDSPGSDTRTNRQLNAEWFVLKNVSGRRVNLKGWSVRDRTGYTYRFSSTFYLRAGATVKVHTGRGTNTAGHRYWGRGWYVWNNTGDKATLRNGAGTLKDSCAWTSAGSGFKSC